MEITLTADKYDEVVLGADGTVLIDFFATWCPPCRAIAPVIAEVAEEHPEITVCKVNVDDEPALADRFTIKFVPTLAVLRHGKLLASVSTYMDKAGGSAVSAHIERQKGKLLFFSDFSECPLV